MSPSIYFRFHIYSTATLLTILLPLLVTSHNVVDSEANRHDLLHAKDLKEVSPIRALYSDILPRYDSKNKSENHVKTISSENRLLRIPNKKVNLEQISSHEAADFSQRISSKHVNLHNVRPHEHSNHGPQRPIIVKPIMRSALTHVPVHPSSTQQFKSKLSTNPEPWRSFGPLVSSIDFPYTRRMFSESLDDEIESRSTVIQPKWNSRAKSTTTNVKAAGESINANDTFHQELALFPSPALIDSDNFISASAEQSSQEKGFILKEWTTQTPEEKPDVHDYHNRNPSPLKKYKFTQKLRPRPRLRIRRPGDVQRGEHTSSVNQALSLPQLTPFLPPDSPEPLHREVYPRRKPQTDSDTDELLLDSKESGSFEGTSGSFGGGNPLPSGIDFNSGSIDIVSSGVAATHSPPQQVTPKLAPTKMSMEGQNSKLEDVKLSKPTPAERPPEEFVVPQNSGLRPVAPPPEFQGGFGSSNASPLFGPGSGNFQHGTGFTDVSGIGSGFASNKNDLNSVDSSFFTGDSALTPNRRGPTGDGYGPPILSGAAVPPPVPAVSVGGSAAGIPPPYQVVDATQNPPTTLKPSALLNVLSKADLGFNQAMTHFERGTPMESAAIDILEVALGSQKLDSQARLLGHVDRAIGIDNLQRLQRWANTGGALDSLKEQLAKLAKNFSPPEHLFPTIPPQLSHLFSSTNR